MTYLLFGLLIAAGAAIVAQNLLMAHMTAAVSTILITLVMNSAVGLLALLTLLVTRFGFAGVNETLASFRGWSLLPGLLGSFFVFASIVGYQRLGPPTTISILVASQLIFGLAVDMTKLNTTNMQSYLPAIAGAALLVVGAFLIASRHV